MNNLKQYSFNVAQTILSVPQRLSKTPAQTGLSVLPLALALAVFIGAYPSLRAQDTATTATIATAPAAKATGTIEGRVYFPAQDRYLERVRVSIQDTDKVAYTDDTGTFYFDNVPAGAAQITAVFSGFTPRSRTVTVVSGATTNADIEFTAEEKRKGEGDVVQMEKYVVAVTREELGAAIAEQEQRNAVNIKTVVSTDEFGINPTGNIGEFLQNIAEVEVDLADDGEVRSIGLSGADSDYVPVSYGGIDFASADSENMSGRKVQLQQFSLNNISRIEITFAATPEHRGDMLGGSIDLVPKGAFESRRAKFEFSTSIILTDREFTLGRTPGPLYEPTKKTKPSWEFTYTNPVSKKFGFTVSGAYNYSSVTTDDSAFSWHGITNTPSALPDVANPYSAPYIYNYSMTINSYLTERTSAAITADWRLGRADRISLGISYSYMDQLYGRRRFDFRVSTADLTKTNMEHVEGTGYTRMPVTARRRIVTTLMPTLSYAHVGKVWRIEANAGWSRSDSTYSDTSNGYFRLAEVQRGELHVVMDKPLGASVASDVKTYIQGTDTEVDYRQINQSYIRKAQSRPAVSDNEKITFYVNARRNFDIFGVPVIIKTGLDIRQQVKDTTCYGAVDYAYYGPDGLYISKVQNAHPGHANAADNIATGFEETFNYKQFSKSFGLGDFQFLNNSQLYNHYLAHPAYWKTSIPSSVITYSRYAEETISAGYLRGDVSFFDNRLYLITGVRFERTDVTGKGPARGPAADGVAAYWVERGQTNKTTYDTWFPSVNAIYKIWEDRIEFRGSWTKTIGRPKFDVYNGTFNLPDVDAEDDGGEHYITLSSGNTLKPWTASTFRGELIYYFVRSGQFRVSAFTRDYTNRHVDTISPLTDDMRSYYDLGEEYDDYLVSTTKNSSDKLTLRVLSLFYKQSLTFLPNWARGLTVTSSVTWRSKSGKEARYATGSTFVNRGYKASLAYNRGRVRANVTWSWRDRYIRDIYEGSKSAEPGALRYVRPTNMLAASVSYKITRRISIYANGRNLLNRPNDEYELYSPSTPGGSQLSYTRSTGVRITFGLQGEF